MVRGILQRLGSILGVQAFTQTKWQLVEKLHYIPIFLLCGFSNILSMILWLRSWSYYGMGDIDSDKFIELIIVHGTAIVIIATFTYLDGVFIYHKVRNAEMDIFQHTIAVVGFVSTAVKMLYCVSATYFLNFSRSGVAHLTSGIFLIYLIDHGRFNSKPQREGLNTEHLFFVTIFAMTMVKYFMLYYNLSNLYGEKMDKDDFSKMLNLSCTDEIFLFNFSQHYIATTVRSICMFRRNPDWKNLGWYSDDESSHWDSNEEFLDLDFDDEHLEIEWRRRG